MRVPLLLLVLLAGLFAACISVKGPPECRAPGIWTLGGPWTTEGKQMRSYFQPVSALVWANNTHTEPARIRLEGHVTPNNGYVFPRMVRDGSQEPVPPGFTAFGIMREPKTERSLESIRIDAVLHEQGASPFSAKCVSQSHITIVVAAAENGKVAKPGQGVLVGTAGFWTNGTMFYTNMKRVHEDATIPRGGSYTFESDEPLKVYIYNNSRSELPRRYNESGYATTIPGFNHALKNMETTSNVIAELSPTEAYTRPGNERHPLYGDALVFYIELVDLANVACKVPLPVPTAPCPDV